MFMYLCIYIYIYVYIYIYIYIYVYIKKMMTVTRSSLLQAAQNQANLGIYYTIQ